MATINSSYSIPEDEYENFEKLLKNCESVIEKPNKSEIVRVAIHNLSKEKNLIEISEILDDLGRKKRGRKAKQQLKERDGRQKKIDLKKTIENNWDKFQDLFPKDKNAERLLSEILFEAQNSWKRDIKRELKTSKATRWRRLNKWKESGVWSEIYTRLLKLTSKHNMPELKDVFLSTYLNERKGKE